MWARASGLGRGTFVLWLSVLFACAASTWVDAASAAAAPFRTGSPDPWVVPVDLGDAPESKDSPSDSGPHFRLVDYQIRIRERSSEAYSRFAALVTDESALQTASQISIEFDPSYQQLTIHSVLVRRGDQVIEHLDAAAFHVVQREKNLDAQVYDGRLSAIMFIPDVRVGDVVDYAYTIGGIDPTLDGHFDSSLPLGDLSRLGRLHVRVLAPRSGRLRFIVLGPGNGIAPETHDRGADEEHVWDLWNTPAYAVEWDAPPSFDQLPRLQITEFGSWEEVAAIGARLFAPAAQRRAVDAWIAETRRRIVGDGAPTLQGRDVDSFILAATRFVQDEVRYVALEVGMSRRRPSDPAVVLDRRFGDCKDKVALLVALLRGAGIAASPALVSTVGGLRLDGIAPSMAAFDHVIVRSVDGSGVPLWIDPTLTLQGGHTDRMRFGSFDRALILDGHATELAAIEREPAVGPSPYIRDVYRVSVPGSGTETNVDSVREYHGSVADTMRAAIQAVSRDALRKGLLAKYQVDYPSAREAGPMGVFDDRDRDTLRIELHLAVPNLWSAADSTGKYAAPFSAHVLEADLPRPASIARTAPLALPFPSHVRYEVEAVLPFPMPMQPQDETRDAPGLHFEFTGLKTQQRLLYTYDIETKEAEVPAAAMAKYAAAVDPIRALLSRVVTYKPAERDRPNWWMLAPLTASLAASIWAARRTYRYEPPPRPDRPADPRYAGLRGWLILLALQFVVAPIRLVPSFAKIYRALCSVQTWSYLTTERQPGYRPGLAALLLFDGVLAGPLLLAFLGTNVVAFFLRRRSFPRSYVVLTLLSVAMALIDHIASERASGSELVVSLFMSMVWITYLTRSRRVAATFVN